MEKSLFLGMYFLIKLFSLLRNIDLLLMFLLLLHLFLFFPSFLKFLLHLLPSLLLATDPPHLLFLIRHLPHIIFTLLFLLQDLLNLLLLHKILLFILPMRALHLIHLLQCNLLQLPTLWLLKLELEFSSLESGLLMALKTNSDMLSLTT